MGYLYHYTNLETLALILKNKTLKFNSLLYVDDVEEAETSDMDLLGKYAYVSCWTHDSEESVPLWNMYTHDMHGVRICLPESPFKQFKFLRGEYGFIEDVATPIDFHRINEENKLSITADNPKLIDVEYTDDKEKLFPRVKQESYLGIVDDYLSGKAVKGEFSYMMKDVGRCKRLNWAFQKECRYRIIALPMGYFERQTLEDPNKELIRRMENPSRQLSCDYLFLSLSDEALLNLKVLAGPKMSEGEYILLQSLLQSYCPEAVLQKSSLRIRDK